MPHRPSRAAAAALTLALSAVSAAPALAAAEPDFEGALLCRSIAEGPARLACYDAALAEAAGDSPGPVAAAPIARPALPAAPAMTAEASFGATKEMIAETTNAPEDLDEITSEIIEAKANARGALTLRLANGQVWREVSDYGRAPLRKDQTDLTARISRGAMGKFRMRLLPTRHIIRVERVK